MEFDPRRGRQVFSSEPRPFSRSLASQVNLNLLVTGICFLIIIVYVHPSVQDKVAKIGKIITLGFFHFFLRKWDSVFEHMHFSPSSLTPPYSLTTERREKGSLLSTQQT